MGKSAVHTIADLREMQALPLNLKVHMTKRRIKDWINEYGTDGVYISFSGGKDSTVLLDLVRQVDPDVPAVFVDTGLEYPEIREFVKTFDNVEWLKPKMNFKKVIETYGYPFISKEVSECVMMARKFVKKYKEENRIEKTDDIEKIIDDGVNIISERDGWGDNSRGFTKLIGALGNDGKFHSEFVKKERDKELQDELQKMIFEDEKNGTARTQMLAGLYTDNGKSKGKDIGALKSNRFNHQKYIFFLDAPFEISNQCCAVMKKSPVKEYAKRTGRYAITGQLAEESHLRTLNWLINGCNGFEMKKPISNPMAFWTEQDVLQYIYDNKIPIASVYGNVVKDDDVVGQLDFSDIGLGIENEDSKPKLRTTGCSRTGCMFCGYGCHFEKSPSRFERMKKTHPKQYEYIMKPWDQGGLGYKEVIDWINEHGNLNIKY